MSPTPRPGILQIEPYVPGKSSLPGGGPAASPTSSIAQATSSGAKFSTPRINSSSCGRSRAGAEASPVKPDSGFTAFFVELTYTDRGRFPMTFTTEVVVTPDRYPFESPLAAEVSVVNGRVTVSLRGVTLSTR